MIGFLLATTLAVLPADRKAMADRLLDRGDYARARAEYLALASEPSIPADSLLYARAECERLLKNTAEARRLFGELIDKHPTSKFADRARLHRALAGSPAEQKAELPLLDSDRVARAIRAEALYRYGLLVADADLLARAVKVDPKGPFVAYADYQRAAILARSDDPKIRRSAVELFVQIAFGGTDVLAQNALFSAARLTYGDKRYGESSTLFRRYLKACPASPSAADARTMAAWSDYLSGKYADALQLCGDGTTDDLAYLKAIATQATGDHATAEKLLRKYLDDFPTGRYREGAELPLARLALSAALKRGDAKAALENARRAQTLSKSPADGLSYAWACENAGQTNEAIRAYDSLARAHPKTVEGAKALYLRAVLDYRAGRWSAAELALAEALATGLLGDLTARALYLRGMAAIAIEHEAEGANFLRSALKGTLSLNESREARLSLADVDFRAGKIDDAKAAYTRLVSEGACERMSAAKLLQVGKLLSGAPAKMCAEMLTKSPSPEWRQAGFARLGALAEEENSFVAAIAAYRRAVAEPAAVEDLPQAVLRLGILESRAGETETAKKTLDRAVELNALNPRARAEAYLALARNCVLKKDFKSARGYATVVVSLFDDPEICGAAEKILTEHPEEGTK